MLIAIHDNKIGFTTRWILYLQKLGVKVKLVNCYDSDIIKKISDCDALMWHHWQVKSEDILKAKRLLFAIEQSGSVVFPNFNTAWHFDDKIAQKYLLESMKLPLVPSYHFLERQDALNWASTTDFPEVFKLTRGAGSANVKLIRTRKEAVEVIYKSFSSGHSVFNRFGGIKERWRKYKNGNETLLGVFKSLYRIITIPRYAKLIPRERFEVYFQDFIPNNNSDIRVIVIGDKAFAIKRLVRRNDFRASGSGLILYEKLLFDECLIEQSFNFASTLKVQVVAFDFVFEMNQRPLIVEISYGYAIEGYQQCVGYWDRNLTFHYGEFDSCEWMVDLVLKQINERK